MRILEYLSTPKMPTRVFVSHAFSDASLGIIDRLKSTLPANVIPVIFPEIRVPPEQRVSDDLIAAILDCEGLVHIQSRNSTKSVWVNFERDFALRKGLQVFSYDAASNRLRRDRGRPIRPVIFPSFARRDDDRVSRIINFMEEERAFELRAKPNEQWKSNVRESIDAKIAAGGYFVFFASNNAAKSNAIDWELSYMREKSPMRVLVAVLEPLEDDRLSSQLQGFATLKLFELAQPNIINQNRVDDLIVRLYALIFAGSSNGKPTSGVSLADLFWFA